MSRFEGYDSNGFFEDMSGIYHGHNPLNVTVQIARQSLNYRPSERMAAGRQMFKLGIGSIVAPIPGSLDEAVGTALVIAGVATIISEGMKR